LAGAIPKSALEFARGSSGQLTEPSSATMPIGFVEGVPLARGSQISDLVTSEATRSDNITVTGPICSESFDFLYPMRGNMA
jgi:hypothetical protein